MGKRAFERVPEKVLVDVHYDNQMYEGTVTNLSCNGLYIDVEMCPPLKSNVEVVLIMGDEVFKLPGKVSRLANTKALCVGMGIELSAISKSYCKFVSIVQDYSYQK